MKTTHIRFLLLALAGATLCWFMPGADAASRPEKPNVIVFLMDDLGWNDLGFTGSKFYESPNIDRLSQRGMVFTQAYAAPICSPSRASLLTGLDPARTGFFSPRGGDPLEVLKAHVQPRIYTQEELKTNWRELPGGMKYAPPNQKALQVVSVSRLLTDYPTMAKTFAANGYRTGHFGKWHLGPEPYSPLQQGFDVDVPHVNRPGPLPPGHFGPWPEWEGEQGPENKGRPIDDCLAANAIKFIQENKGRPFFLNFWTFGVHGPHQAQKEMIEYFKAKADPNAGQNNPVYAGMIKNTDAAIGRVWKAVEEAGLAQKTVVVFYSDNGGVNIGTPRITDNSPLRGGKGDIYEGGVRVPGFVIWPGVTQPGTKCDLPIHLKDVFPTVAEICGIKEMPKVDGRSFVPALTGKRMEARPVFTHLPYGLPATAVMLDGWKLIRYYYDGPGQQHRFELYHLASDPGERLDCSRVNPEMVAKLDKLIEAYGKEMGAVLPQPNPDYRGALKGEFEGMAYELLEPTYKRGKAFPLIVCLSGSDKIVEGNPAYADLQKTSVQFKHPAYLLALAHPKAGNDEKSRAESQQQLFALIQKVVQENPIQPRWVYLTGEGKGAVDAWEMAARNPNFFAAALPVGGAGSPSQAVALKELPVWAFHGAHDPVMPVADSRTMNEALKAAGTTVALYTEYTENEQVQLNGVWGNLEVIDWLFNQTRPIEKGKK